MVVAENKIKGNVYKRFEEANQTLNEAEEELAAFVIKFKGESNKKPNQYECMVRDTLSLYQTPADKGEKDLETPKHKKPRRSETPMSSIDIMSDKSPDDDAFSPID